MQLVYCPVCEGQISSMAADCCHCGHPMIQSTETPEQPGRFDSAWSAVTKSRTPINVFSIAMMACAAVLGVSATTIDNAHALEGFTFALVLFFGVSGMFSAILLFCRRGLYHPQDLAKAKQQGVENFGDDRPELAGLLILFVVMAYGAFHFLS